MLIYPVFKRDIKQAIFSMDDSKSPGVDGYTSAFFKEVWAIIGRDITKAVQALFNRNYNLRQFKKSSITFVPKTNHASSIAYYRPIACYTVVYKAISKILTSRLQDTIVKIVDEAQTGFIPRHLLSDDILLAAELVKAIIENTMRRSV